MKPSKEAGYTLVEVVVSQFTMVILLIFAYWMWQTTLQTSSASFDNLRNVNAITYDLQKLVDDLREARDGEDGAYLLFRANDTEVGFYADIDGDLVSERVRYFLDGQALKIGVVKATGDPPSYVLSSETIKTVGTRIMNGSQPIFTYYNKNWPGDTVHNPLIVGERLLNTRLITVHLIVGREDAMGEQPSEITAYVHLRNLKDNY